MQNVELIYDDDCPNWKIARKLLKRALRMAGLPARWQEWNRADPASPQYVRCYGSPTILVDGQDVAGGEPTSGEVSSCRLYTDSKGGRARVPSVETMLAALTARSAAGQNRTGAWAGSWRHLLATVPGAGAVLLPVGLCPACWPAYAGVLASLGLPFLLETRYLFALVVTFLAFAVGSLGWRAKGRHGYRPFLLGVAAATAIVGGKFLALSGGLVYSGVGLLFAASVWNAWPRQKIKTKPCPGCRETAATYHHDSLKEI